MKEDKLKKQMKAATNCWIFYNKHVDRRMKRQMAQQEPFNESQ